MSLMGQFWGRVWLDFAEKSKFANLFEVKDRYG